MSVSFVNKNQKDTYEKLLPLVEKFKKRAFKIDEEGTFPFENIQELKEAGYTRLSLESKYGGDELRLYDFLLFQELIAQGDASTALSIGWHMGITMDLREKQPWNQQMLDFIFKEIEKGALINTAATEPKTGSPTRGGKPETTAVKTKKGWQINGRKTFTTMSPVLNYFLVKASIEGEEEIGLFLIPRETSGLSIEETWDMIAMRGTGSHDLVLENVDIEHDFLVERLGGFKKNEPSGWLLHIPACYMGTAIAARDYAVAFAKEYSPNSIEGTISELPNVQRLVGEMELELMQARHFMYSVASKWDETSDRSALAGELAAVKHVVTNSACTVVDKAMRIVGARSLQRSNPLQRYYRDVRAGLHNPPMDDMTIINLAKQAFTR
ncbi:MULTISPECIES: acyl-CoA dehydrogenase family protein [Priestia]|uniref:acyl-CoA dehydrogenase family protein n=1 Tax=Priestia TaxID=2800373 RepID=UPI0008DE3265|nr:acyl-CoA dehydrogenase family protein [Priestia aryabhattai]MBZ6487235.1 acyl-CoA/acyl-ACP dehydrogenase [Priestia aryabhattai]MDH3114089.1 acyl-CoA/acyl-ACP dehydrogenase [Priestia aryabhattai]MDH3127011.1 acyl-CoA/acyl-ACP dehydrogenase [Priestia aryabhattai]MDH3132747.1 acyl-CoA/acyl-ACP dehydrogenase [Priestia aryabhattai]MED4153588.1 acyl-CoA/acyl-ACP dehydrogenase [Priestia aryabhattai]